MLELVIDSFAGGGGASEGIRAALGRDPDIAVNHDRMALAMHRINHPGTRHLVQDVLVVDSVSMCAGQPIGLLWMSPDCTDHSKAKGGPPRRGADSTRGLAWAIVGWVKALPKWQRPRVIVLENVEEFAHWGPLTQDGKRCPLQKGAIFKQFVQAWRDLGYPAIEWRERRAWKAGAPTIRKRLYMVIRRDGEPIVWPEPAFGNPSDPADAGRIARGELQPWRTAASHVIDFSLPGPSIFDTAEEIKRKFGVRAKRPLVFNTRARLAVGTKRHVLDNPRPFLVKVNHTARGEPRDRALGLPVTSLTLTRDDAVAVPIVTYAQQGGGTRPSTAPLHTVCASEKDQNGVIMPYVTKFNSGSTGHKIDEPLHTVTAHASATHGGGAAPLGLVSAVLVGCGGRAAQSEPQPGDAPVLTQTGKPDLCVAVPMLVPRYGERDGQEPRSLSVDRPHPTPVPTGNEAGLAAVFIAQHTAGSHPGSPAHRVEQPTNTILGAGSQHGVVAASMLTLRGSDRRDASVDAPVRTQSAGGQHSAVISLPLMTVYYGTDDDGAPVDQPSRTETEKPRFGLVDVLACAPPFGREHEPRAREVAEFLRSHGCWGDGEFVTLDVDGHAAVLVDIGMRMLTPRERFNAQGFRPDYIIDRGILEDGSTVHFTLEQQGRMCGNSVCPAEAEALVRANYRPREVLRPASRKAPLAMPLFQEAAE
ncbi:DNA (cytosine-5)-methyltransferase 1 [Angulomicrobium tetraedrale]|uniref:DNA (cytosine-5-)-methyltransferase n=1 Tax=Ancylobacter tetraedralis TaxID=217068 RepID=A0A839Z9X9_9HYPH|nr:DNA cytosine methyltransferase [Ancylobacter tetraedralis]MBB3771544.1 DNA (cytosine-5)-methyltransferase 1 [Ancylobacter tetraedralis]